MRAPEVRLYANEAVADLFAGGGGASTGIAMALGRAPDVAINHDAEALAMHNANHPETRHMREDIRDVEPRRAMAGQPCGLAWFSPDCTFHSKARGGKPFRDGDRARRIRGLIGIVLKWAAEVAPRVIFVENVEEIEDWCPLGDDGRPDPARRGENFQRWVARLRNLGYQVEWRQLRASHYGAPTSRKRLFIIARRDGKPIVWPAASHGTEAQPFRTAAECIDFTLPVPSIFLTPSKAKAWAKAHGCETPRRPLAPATLRRIARGVQRFVLDSPEPFIVRYNGERGAFRGQGLGEPLTTLDTSNRFALVAPSLAPFVVNNMTNNVPRPVTEPLATILTGGHKLLVAPALIQTSYGERKGQAPRVLDLHEPLGTIVAGGIKHSLVAAFLAKHNGGHEATGQRMSTPVDSVTCKDTKALVTSHLMKLYGTAQAGQQLALPMPTVTSGGNHIAEVRAFLLKYYGTKADGCALQAPLDTVTTKGRYGLVTVKVGGDEYAIVDIGMRMLTPRELFRAQGFPEHYQIDRGVCIRTRQTLVFTKKTQTRLVGNSVPPHVASAIVSANLAEAV